MPVTRLEINRALDVIIDNLRGADFQRLAVQLGRGRFPGLFGNELSKDGGQDAQTQVFASDSGKRIGVGCSLTATLGKVRGDCTTIASGGHTIDLFVFFTPVGVSKRKIDGWREAIVKEFPWDLMVVTREEIAESLLRPEHAWICEKYLELRSAANPALEPPLEAARAAARRVTEGWKRQLRLNNTPTVALGVVTRDDKAERVPAEQIAKSLLAGDRIALCGEPGAGKTTTLVQLAEHLLATQTNSVPILVALPAWLAGHAPKELLSYVASSPEYLGERVSVEGLAALSKAGHLVFLFNGWNEIAEGSLVAAANALSAAAREQSASGILIATRVLDNTIPIPFNIVGRLAPLTGAQRRHLIDARLSAAGGRLINTIEGEEALERITRTPLFLSAIIDLAVAGIELPKTRFGILQALIKTAEGTQEHQVVLATAPMRGLHRRYLEGLASVLTRAGAALLTEDDAIAEIALTTTALRNEGRAVGEDPKALLDLLIAHHLLVSEPAGVRFSHQQFQEWFAATWLLRQSLPLASDAQAVHSFKKHYLDNLAWEVPLLFFAESHTDVPPDNPKQAGIARVIRWAMTVDPLFAARLTAKAGPNTPPELRYDLRDLLRRWYAVPSAAHRGRALAGMLATGWAEFSDIVWQLLENADDADRYRVYRARDGLSLSSLGPEWNARVRAWSDDRRRIFVAEIGHHPDVILQFAIGDPALAVRIEALHRLYWHRQMGLLFEALEKSGPETIEAVASDSFLLGVLEEDVPPSVRTRIETAKAAIDRDIPAGRARLSALCSSFKGTPEDVAALRSELLRTEGDETDGLAAEAAKRLAQYDPEAVASWVVQQIEMGRLWRADWRRYISKAPEAVTASSFEAALTNTSEPQERRVRLIAANSMTSARIDRALDQYLAVYRRIRASSPRTAADSDNYHSLQQLLIAAPLGATLAGVVRLGPNLSETDLFAVLDLLSRPARAPERADGEDDEEFGDVTVAQADVAAIRAAFPTWLSKVLSAVDGHGEFKAALATVISIFGEPSNLDLIRALVEADTKRLAEGRADRQAGRQTPAADGCHMHWSNWYVRAIRFLAGRAGAGFLKELLNNADYEQDAAHGLAVMAADKLWFQVRHGIRYDEIFEARAAGRFSRRVSEDARDYAGAISARLAALTSEALGQSDRSLAYRVTRLVLPLAAIGDGDHYDLVLRALSVPGDVWSALWAIDVLYARGAVIPAQVLIAGLGPFIDDHLRRQWLQENELFTIVRCLCILLLSSNGDEAIRYITLLLPRLHRSHLVRDLIEALGRSTAPGATALLLDLARNPDAASGYPAEIATALSYKQTAEVKAAFLDLLIPAPTQILIRQPSGFQHRDALPRAFSRLMASDDAFKAEVLNRCSLSSSSSTRNLVAEALKALGTPEAIEAAVTALAMGGAWVRGFLRDVLTSQQTGSGSWTALVPSADNKLRAGLLRKLIEERQFRDQIFDVLGVIEEIRDDYGKPVEEPRHPDIDTMVAWPRIGWA